MVATKTIGHLDMGMELELILGLLIAGWLLWLLIKWAFAAILFVIGDIGEHFRGECACYRPRDDD